MPDPKVEMRRMGLDHYTRRDKTIPAEKPSEYKDRICNGMNAPCHDVDDWLNSHAHPVADAIEGN